MFKPSAALEMMARVRNVLNVGQGSSSDSSSRKGEKDKSDKDKSSESSSEVCILLINLRC